jgi:hypothetical protein
MPHPKTPVAGLGQELDEARAAFLAAVSELTPTQVGSPHLVGGWGLREVIAHLGYWTGHLVEAIHLVEQDRADEFEDVTGHVEERNDTVAGVARETDLATVRRREEASFLALAARLAGLDPGLLAVRLPSGDTLADQLRIDGPEHYREHEADIRKVATGGPTS